MIRILLLPVIAFVLLSACSSGKKAFERGNYEDAVLTAIDRLRKNPNSKKAWRTLADAYPYFISYNQDRIKRALALDDPLKWEEILACYGQINEVYDEINRSPVAKQAIPDPKYFPSEYREAAKNAAVAHYQLGEQAMIGARQGNREAAKTAYEHFARCDDLQPGYQSAARLAEEAREMAMIRVVVEPIPLPSRVLEISSTFFYNQLMEYLVSEQPSPFVRFVDVRETGIVPDQVVQLVFDDYVVGQAYIKETIRERSRDSVVVGQTTTVENGREVRKDVYGTVKAEMHQFQKEINSSGILDCQIIDSSNAVLAQEKFPGSFTWVDYWGFYNGDERALIDEDKTYLRNSREVPPPPPQDLFVEFTKPIFQNLTQFLTSYYRNY